MIRASICYFPKTSSIALEIERSALWSRHSINFSDVGTMHGVYAMLEAIFNYLRFRQIRFNQPVRYWWFFILWMWNKNDATPIFVSHAARMLWWWRYSNSNELCLVVCATAFIILDIERRKKKKSQTHWTSISIVLHFVRLFFFFFFFLLNFFDVNIFHEKEWERERARCKKKTMPISSPGSKLQKRYLSE